MTMLYNGQVLKIGKYAERKEKERAIIIHRLLLLISAKKLVKKKTVSSKWGTCRREYTKLGFHMIDF